MTRRVAVYCKGNRRQDIYHQTIKIANEHPEKLKKLQIEERFGFPNTAFQSGGLINYILEEERKEK